MAPTQEDSTQDDLAQSMDSLSLVNDYDATPPASAPSQSPVLHSCADLVGVWPAIDESMPMRSGPPPMRTFGISEPVHDTIPMRPFKFKPLPRMPMPPRSMKFTPRRKLTSQPFLTFERFPEFAPEIRKLIWEFAANQHRNVDIWIKQDNETISWKYYTTRSPPAILHTCIESRAAGLKFYTLDLGNCARFEGNGIEMLLLFEKYYEYLHEKSPREQEQIVKAGVPRIYINWKADNICVMDNHEFRISLPFNKLIAQVANKNAKGFGVNSYTGRPPFYFFWQQDPCIHQALRSMIGVCGAKEIMLFDVDQLGFKCKSDYRSPYTEFSIQEVRFDRRKMSWYKITSMEKYAQLVVDYMSEQLALEKGQAAGASETAEPIADEEELDNAGPDYDGLDDELNDSMLSNGGSSGGGPSNGGPSNGGPSNGGWNNGGSSSGGLDNDGLGDQGLDRATSTQSAAEKGKLGDTKSKAPKLPFGLKFCNLVWDEN